MRQSLLDDDVRDSSPPREPLRLHLNEAPWGPPATAVHRIRAAAHRVNVYPIGDTQEAVGAVARHFGVERDQVILTTGVDEATDLCLLEMGELLTVIPGFNGFRERALALERPVREFTLEERSSIPAALSDAATVGRMVMLANPNNPTGLRFPDWQLLGLLEQGCHLLLDETYADFAGHAPGLDWLESWDRLIVFRSFSKSFGLGGLRIGCMIGHPPLMKRLRARQAYYPLDRLAVEGLLAALEHEPDFPLRLAARVRPLRARLTGELRTSGVFQEVLDSSTNFVLARCRDRADARRVRTLLAEMAGVLVASAEPFGVPEGLRIAVGDDSDIDVLARGLRAVSQKLREEAAVTA